MTTDATPSFFGKDDTTELLDLLIDEAAASLSLLSEFELGDLVADDATLNDRPGGDDSIRIAFRLGFKTQHGVRVGFFQLPLEDALVLAGSLLMLPTEELKSARSKGAPDEGDKDAILEVGNLIGGAFDSVLRKRFDDQTNAIFAGCQGVEAGHAPWVPQYQGEALAVRRQSVSFRSFEPFELLLAIPA